MNKVIPTLSVALAAIPLSLGVFSSAAFAQSTDSSARVFVNHQQVDFQGQPPIEQNGHLLVPLRSVLEKLGAYVDFNSSTQTVIAQRGATRILLPIGSQQATVNGRSISLDVPAQVVNGSTLVPLRFVAESLGADVNYDVSSDSVAINDTVSSTGSAELPGNRDGGAWHHHDQADTTLTGTVTAVYADTDPAHIVIRIPGNGDQERTIPLRPNAVITIQRPGMPEQKMPLDRIGVGSTVAVLMDHDGDASAVNLIDRVRPHDNPPSANREFRGEFSDFSRRDNDTYVLRTADGRHVEVRRDSPVFYNNQRMSLDDLRSGDRLIVTLDPRTQTGVRISIVRN